MDLKSLRHFIAVARSLSFTKAAEELGLSQSALTRSIQSLERRGNLRLLDRDRGGVHLTPVGRDFLQRASALLRDAQDLQWYLERSATGSIGEVAFGMSPIAAAALAPNSLAHNLHEHPELRSHVWVRTADALLSLLVREEIQFFVCAEGQLPSDAPVRSAVLGRFPRSLLVRAGHPLLAGKQDQSLSDFPWIVSRELDLPNIQQVVDLQVKPTIILEDFGSLARIAQMSDAVWLASTYAAVEEIHDGRLVELQMPAEVPAAKFRMMMYSLERRTLSPAALTQLDQFKARIQSIRV